MNKENRLPKSHIEFKRELEMISKSLAKKWKTTQKKCTYSCKRIPFRLTFSISSSLFLSVPVIVLKGRFFHCYCVMSFWKVILHAIKMDNKLSHFCILAVMQQSSKVSSYFFCLRMQVSIIKLMIKNKREKFQQKFTSTNKKIMTKLNSPYN